MNRYRILYHHRIRADDGQAVHVRELIDALRALGHEVLECALLRKSSAPAAAAHGRWLRQLRLPRTMTELLEIGYSSRGARMLQEAGAAFGPHFLYERHALHCRAGLRAAAALGVPLLLEVNSPMCDEMMALGALRFPARARASERVVLAGADRVLAVSDVLRRRLVDLGAPAERTLVVRNAGDPERYASSARRMLSGLPADAFVLGFVGYMRPWHRLDLALEALGAPGLERVHLVLVGAGPALPEVQARAARLQLGHRVHMRGAVSSRELPSLVRCFDAALLPAINGYASPLKVFDALAAGVVNVAPDQENVREILEHGQNAMLFVPGSAAALAARIGDLVADRGRASALGAAGQALLLARGWTWNGNARRVVEAYEQVAAERIVAHSAPHSAPHRAALGASAQENASAP